MGDKTRIFWFDATWNPTTGCSKVSKGCDHCYAESGWSKIVHLPTFKGRAFTDVAYHPVRLYHPFLWKKPRRILVNSMSDLFHDDVPDSFIDQVFAVMAMAKNHTFQVLTKRPERMRAYVERLGKSAKLLDDAARTIGRTFKFQGSYLVSWPLPNVWIGVSVEDQATADERIPVLLKTTAAVRWISAEPLLGQVDLWRSGAIERDGVGDGTPGTGMSLSRGLVDWVVVGGESGPKSRPMHPDWVRSIRDQCYLAGVPFLFKNWGEWGNDGRIPMLVSIHEKRYFLTIDGKKWTGPSQCCPKGTAAMLKIGKRAAGRLLDGVQHDGYPESL